MNTIIERDRAPTLGTLLSRVPQVAIPLIQKHFLLFSACFLAVFVLARMDDWFYRNEVFAWMSGGVPYEVGHPSLEVLVDAAVANCQSLSGPELEVCQDYQNTLKGSSLVLHPIHSFFSARLVDSYGSGPWLNDLHAAAVWSTLAGGLLMIGFWALFVYCLPWPSRIPIAALSLLLLVMGHYRDEPGLLLPDPFADGVQTWEAVVMPLIAALFVFGSRLARYHPVFGGGHLTHWLSVHRKRVVQVFLAALVLNFALPPIGAALPQILAFGVLLLAVWWLTSLEDVLPWIAGCLLVFLFIMVSGDHEFILRKLEVSKRQLSLVVGMFIVYLTARPRGRLCWLLPTFAVFHVPAMAGMGLALFLAELPICLRRLKFSPLLCVSAATFAAAYWFTNQSQTNLGDPTDTDVLEVISMVWANPRFWPTVVVLALVACVSLWPLLRRDENWDSLARCGFLAMEGIGATFVAFAILDVAPDLRLTTGFYDLVQIHKFLGPPISFGLVLSLSYLLFQTVTTVHPDAEPQTAGPARDWHLVAPVLVIVVLMGLAKIDFAPRLLVLDALRNSVVYVALGRPHRDWCTYLAQGAGFDDHYILSGDKPTNGAENAYSALKLKIRILAKVHDPEAMEVSVSVPQENGC